MIYGRGLFRFSGDCWSTTSSTDSFPEILVPDRKLLSFPNANAAHNFNAYFVDIAQNLILENYGNDVTIRNYCKYMPERQSKELKDCNFTSDDVEKIILKLNSLSRPCKHFQLLLKRWIFSEGA